MVAVSSLIFSQERNVFFEVYLDISYTFLLFNTTFGTNTNSKTNTNTNSKTNFEFEFVFVFEFEFVFVFEFE